MVLLTVACKIFNIGVNVDVATAKLHSSVHLSSILLTLIWFTSLMNESVHRYSWMQKLKASVIQSL